MNRAKHAFGSSSSIESALQQGLINERDILFLDEDTDNPKIGWIDKNGNPIILKDEKADLTEVEAEIATLETKLATKANADEVDAKIAAAMNEHLTKKYEIADVPDGTIVDYGDKEIRIMCSENVKWTKQNVGTGGDPNAYYMTFKTYVTNDNVVGYREHLGNQVDAEILTDIKTDSQGRRYQPTWLALAKYDETTDTWNYYGKNSSEEKYVGWDYQIDWYDANDVMIGSDCVRINLSNENCHYSTKPYYVGGMIKDIETMVEKKVAEVGSAYEIIEF